MALVHRTYSGRRDTRPLAHSDPSHKISPLIILQARFQQKQLQEKEEKLLKLYEEQQERALKSVGSHSGGSSVSSSSSVGVGKVRHMFQARRGNSESRLGVAITGRDKSYPLEPLTKYPSARNLDRASNQRSTPGRTPAHWGTTPQQRSFSLDRNGNLGRPKHDQRYEVELDENFNYSKADQRKKSGVRRTQSQVRCQKPRSYIAGTQAELQFAELDHDQSFHLVDDHYNKRDLGHRRFRNAREENEDYLVTNYNEKKQFYESRSKSEKNSGRSKAFSKLPSEDFEYQQPDKMESRYKSYVSQTAFNKKPHLGNGTLTGRTGVTSRVTEVKETTHSSGYLNGSVSSPVRKIRKPTPVPLSVAPAQHLLREARKSPRAEPIKEVPTSVSSTRTPASRTTSTPSSLKPPTSGRSVPSARLSPAKSTPTPATNRSAPPSDLVNCRICGRHFAADRVSKHEEVCQKSSRSKRKPFDALQQRVKGTEVEQYVKKSARGTRPQPEKTAKPQSNWRKKHEEFINNIRAAKEVSAHLKKGGKLSDLPPPPPSDYSDYIQCPHCSRKFNSSAAERHIPKCANIINNKPKPNLQKNTGLKQGSKLLHATSPSIRGRK